MGTRSWREGCENEDSRRCLSVKRDGRPDARGGVQSWRQLERGNAAVLDLPPRFGGGTGWNGQAVVQSVSKVFYGGGEPSFFFYCLPSRMGNPRSSRLS